MITEFRLPNLTAQDSAGQIRQLHSFLRQTVEHLNWAMRSIDNGTLQVVNGQGQKVATASGSDTGASAAVDAVTQFANIKGLIIKSADIVNAYYTKIDKLLSTSGNYVASSDFGEYKREVTQEVSASADSLLQEIERVEEVANSANDAVKVQSSYIKYGTVGTTLDETGSAKDDAPGIEIGYFSDLKDESGTHTDQRFARFTAFGLELFGESKETPIATFSGNKMKITNAEVVNLEIKETLKMGGYLIDRGYGLAFKWVGRG